MDVLEEIKAFFGEQEKNGYFLVDVKPLPAQKMLIYADSDKGISVSECGALHRELINTVAATGNYELTLSSPGLNEPFKVGEQYSKNIGKKVEVITHTGQKITGILTSAATGYINIEEQHNGEIKNCTFTIQEIKSTRLYISFKKNKP